MRGVVAKRLRNKVFGDVSIKKKRECGYIEHLINFLVYDKDRKLQKAKRYQRVNVGLRHKYQQIKRDYKYGTTHI